MDSELATREGFLCDTSPATDAKLRDMMFGLSCGNKCFGEVRVWKPDVYKKTNCSVRTNQVSFFTYFAYKEVQCPQ